MGEEEEEEEDEEAAWGHSKAESFTHTKPPKTTWPMHATVPWPRMSIPITRNPASTSGLTIRTVNGGISIHIRDEVVQPWISNTVSPSTPGPVSKNAIRTPLESNSASGRYRLPPAASPPRSAKDPGFRSDAANQKQHDAQIDVDAGTGVPEAPIWKRH